MGNSDYMNWLKSQQELLGEGQNMPWLMYLQIVGRIKTDLKTKEELWRKMTKCEIVL